MTNANFRLLGAINVQIGSEMNVYELDGLIGVFSGEIFNVDALVKQFTLNKKAYANMEVILPIFKAIGGQVIQHLEGFYAGVIYNRDTKKMFFLRDYIGRKSLFSVTSRQLVYVINQLKMVDAESIHIIPKGFSTLINGKVHLLEAHRIGVISKNKTSLMIVEAIKKYIPKNEDRFGVFLSGGLDSSIIASVVAKQNTNVTYYTLGAIDDLRYVNSIASRLGIGNKIKQIGLPKESELPELVGKIVYYTESYNPSIISNGLATYLLSKAAHDDGISIVLTGEGADELFCGYPVSKDVNVWFNKRLELIENMHFTELRRLERTSAPNNITIRCPFLDEDVYRVSNDCSMADLIEGGYGKQILKKAFEHDLPKEILEREKMSFDVGSGIRKMVVEYLTQDGLAEREALRNIWCQFFNEMLSDYDYFHAYPTFDEAISRRGSMHKK